MAEILSWLKDYSPAMVLLLALGASILFVLKLTVEKSIAANFDAHTKKIELHLARRSSFEEKVLTERFALVTSLSARLEKVMTNLNRIRSGQPVPAGFMKQNEIVPLTKIFEELSVHRLVLTEDFHGLFWKKAQLALKAANAQNAEEWQKIGDEWLRLQEEVRVVAEAAFGISKIRW